MEFDENVKKVCRCIAAIPSGCVMSYGEVARLAGFPGRARWIGKILRDADTGDLPWHRVVRSDGKLGFPEGSDAWQRQHDRLESEGVVFRNARVPSDCFAGQSVDLDSALWAFNHETNGD